MPKAKKITKLRMLLINRGVSLTELKLIIDKQNTTGIGLDALSLIVSGQRTNYMLSTLKKICVALNVNPNEVIDE